MDHPQSRPRRPRSVRITPRDQMILAFMADHRIVLAAQIAALLGATEDAAKSRLRALGGGGYVRREAVFEHQPSCYLIRRRGLAVVGSGLPAPALDVRGYWHDLGLAWLWLAARDGTFGPVSEILAERRVRSHDESPERTEPPLAVKLGGYGSGGRERLHYPDLVLHRPDGRRIALELELSAKGRTRLEKILGGYAADRRIDAVLYLVPNRRVGNAVILAAERAGVSSLVHVQLVRAPTAATARGAGLTVTRQGERAGNERPGGGRSAAHER